MWISVDVNPFNVLKQLVFILFSLSDAKMAWCHFHRHVLMVISFTIRTDCFIKWDGDRQIYLLVYLTICEAHKDNHSCFREKCFLPCLQWPFWSGFQIFKKVFEFFVTFHLFSLSCSLQNKLIFVQLGFQFFLPKSKHNCLLLSPRFLLIHDIWTHCSGK